MPRCVHASQIDVSINLVERKSGGLGAGGGLAQSGGLGFVGSATYTEKNLFGLNQKLSAQVELGQIDKMFQVSGSAKPTPPIGII
jgi:outer membrane protein insertion porin family